MCIKMIQKIALPTDHGPTLPHYTHRSNVPPAPRERESARARERERESERESARARAREREREREKFMSKNGIYKHAYTTRHIRTY